MMPLALLMTASLAVGAVDDLPLAGVNLSPVANWESEYPFRDYSRMTPRWHSTNGFVWNDGRTLQMDEFGYPTRLDAQQIARGPVFTAGRANYPPGVYDLTWAGQGTISLRSENGAISEVPDSRTSNSVSYNVLTPNSTGLLMEITATRPNNPARNVELTRQGTEGVFNQQYLNALQGFDVVRMLDWQRVNNSTESTWADRQATENTTWRTVPWELQIEMANQANADLWITIPHAATDDYILQLRNMIDQELDPSLRVWVENSNEVWNGQFTQHRHYGNHRNYAERSGEIFGMFDLGDRMVRVLSGQSASAGLLNTALRTTDADVAAVNAYFKFSPAEWAQYYEDFQAGTATLQQGLDWLRADIDEVAQQWANNKAVADRFNVPLVAYEAGVNINFPHAYRDDDAFVNFVNRLHRQPEMEELYAYHYERWQEYGETIVYYNLSGRWSAGGGLGLVQDFDIPTGKWDGVQQIIGRTDWKAGDANLDGRFETGDLIQVFSEGEYEDGVLCNSGWHEGDWNRDCEFDTSDLVDALQTWGGFSEPPPAVPEPTAPASTALAIAAMTLLRRSQDFRRRRTL